MQLTRTVPLTQVPDHSIFVVRSAVVLAERVKDASSTYQTLGKVPKNVHADTVSALQNVEFFARISVEKITRVTGIIIKKTSENSAKERERKRRRQNAGHGSRTDTTDVMRCLQSQLEMPKNG